MLEKTRSDLEAEVEELQKQVKQMENIPSDVEQLTKVHISIACLIVCVRLFPSE